MKSGLTRRKPKPGTICRIELPDKSFAYAFFLWYGEFWLYDFATLEPARGEDFFPAKSWKWPARAWQVSACFIDCTKVPIDIGWYQYMPKWYEESTEDLKWRYGVTTHYAASVSPEGGGAVDYRDVTDDEIARGGIYLEVRLNGDEVLDFIAKYRPEMSVKEVPPAYLDKRKPKPPKPEPVPVEFRVVLVQSDLETDDPELDIQDVLEEALGDAEAGTVADTGTYPDGTFDIGVKVHRSNRAKALRVIRQVLTKLNCPTSTVIEEAGDPVKTHPLFKRRN